MWVIPILLGVLFFLGIREKKRHNQNIQSIPIRININGIRGKSTITRLVVGILKEAEYRVIGKTTGTSARLIFWDRETEKPIRRRPEGPNISEQIRVVSEVAKRKANCLVSECMAVNPDYQITFQEEMLQANIGVIANVLEDHMDVMGPSLDEVAEALAATIPYEGHLVVTDGPYLAYFTREAKKRKTKVVVANVKEVKEAYLRRFSYMLFPENVAVALGVARVLNVPEEVALNGMLQANPDPGSVRILPLQESSRVFFANGFAANDAFSTLQIWKRLATLGYPTEQATVIMNCREDRMDRTRQFAQDVLPHINIDTLIVIGQAVAPVVAACEAGNISYNKMINLEDACKETIATALQDHMNNPLIYGIGNIHGDAEIVCAYYEKLYEKVGRSSQLIYKRESVSV